MDSTFKSISRKECVDVIAAVGSQVTVMVEGDIGSGKSAMLHDLATRFKATHRAVYIDMTAIDIGDLQMPTVDHTTKTTSFYPNETLGLHYDGPMIIMFDEYGKAGMHVKNAVLPMLIERRLNNRKFHPDTIIFATTNLGAENVGDLFKPHERNRMTFMRMSKPNADEWIEWAVNHDIAAEVLVWVKQNPQCLQSFEDIKNPQDNVYVYHPKAPRLAFVTHRSLEQASRIMKHREHLTDGALTHALKGTIGEAAAADMMMLVTMGQSLPTRDEILSDPLHTPVPASAASLVLLCVQALGWVEADTVDAWLKYMQRFPSTEAQSMFSTLALKNETKLAFLTKNKAFTSWVIDKQYLFS